MTPLIPIQLDTERLRLRPFADGDWRDLYDYYGDAAATRHTFGRQLSGGDSWRIMAGMVGHRAQDAAGLPPYQPDSPG